MKQTKLRRKRVFRYAVLYFTLLIIFLALMIAPSLAGKFVASTINNILGDTNLVQPSGQEHNDTVSSQTGTGAESYSGALLTMSSASATASSTADSAKIRLF